METVSTFLIDRKKIEMEISRQLQNVYKNREISKGWIKRPNPKIEQIEILIVIENTGHMPRRVSHISAPWHRAVFILYKIII